MSKTTTGDAIRTLEPGDLPPRRWKKRRVLPVLALLVLILALLLAWVSRKDIADSIIADRLAQYGLPASYHITHVDGFRQVIDNLVIGDPADPDFTAERVAVEIGYTLGLPRITGIRLVKPRLYGSIEDGALSFGRLDPLIFAESEAPPGLPDMALKIADGRVMIESDYGPVGGAIAGSGNLQSGFGGVIAFAAPELAIADCKLTGAKFSGRVATKDGKPKIAGPLRLTSLACAESGAQLRDLAITLEAASDARFARVGWKAQVKSGEAQLGRLRAAGLGGTMRASWTDGVLALHHRLAARQLRAPQALLANVQIEGSLRAREGDGRLQWRGKVMGGGLRAGSEFQSMLAGLIQSGEGTLLAPLACKFAAALHEALPGGSIAATAAISSDANGWRLVAPRVQLRAQSGAVMATLSDVELRAGNAGMPQIAGNISTGGAGMPQITGQMAQGKGGTMVLHLSMRPYAAKDAGLAIPQLTIRQSARGDFVFSGKVVANGRVPGGTVRNLNLPIKGRWDRGGGLTMWRKCTRIEFGRLQFASLVLNQDNATLCPPRGEPILRFAQDGLQIAAGTHALDLAGHLGESRLRIVSGPVGFAFPGTLAAKQISVTLGPADSASHLTIEHADARLGDDIYGSFSGVRAGLNAVPLDIEEASGNWTFKGGALAITGGVFSLLDRADPDRFEPLAARDASLVIEEGTVTASAHLRNPDSDRVVSTVNIAHDLSSGRGHASLDTAGLLFDKGLQPADISRLALGFVANAKGVVTGKGLIEWNAEGVTSSGRFATEGFDLAAAFGPVKAASGSIEFTDLLGLTTAPHQRLTIGSVNPGIEVHDGAVSFQLVGGTLLALEGGEWPFMGGKLILRQVDLNFGSGEDRRYIFEIVGLEAAQFIAQMDLANLGATGIFDGTLPIIFDAKGFGRIEQGVLISRPPGGNVSYVGELSYEDLSPIANYAFRALRSLDYRQMRILMDGPLTGEIVTRVQFDGVSQGADAERNFITRQLANLPLQFRVNIRAPFYKLMSSFKSLYDPASVRDPRELGLISGEGQRLREEITDQEVGEEAPPSSSDTDEPPVQNQESRKMP